LSEEKKEPKNKEWIELCEYVKKEILRYDDNMKFPSYLALKLQGLKTGKHIANNKTKNQAKYDDYTLLCTFKICKSKILDYLRNNETNIKDEKHKINLIIKFAEQEINDVYIRLQQNKKKEENIHNIDFDNQFNESAKYVKKGKDVKERLKEIW